MEKGFFCNGRKVPFPAWMRIGLKTMETRKRNMLSALVGERVAIVETGTYKVPMVVGHADMVGSFFCPAEKFHLYRDQHLVPADSEFDCTGKGKWCYLLENAKPCDPYPLPSSAVRHGRSWCEF